jgi:murein DD-endopeptidase MepM/ murein hydrolase activator NlpD
MRFSASKGFGCIVIILLIMNLVTGCATTHRTSMNPPPKLKKELDSLKSNTTTVRPAKSTRSSRYTIKQGDTIWRIAFNHSVSPDDIIRINNIRDVTNIKPGQQLMIPASGITGTRKVTSQATLPPGRNSNESFIWPLRGEILYGFDKWVNGYKNKGIDIEAYNGQAVKASKSGMVALTSDRPDGWGKVVVLRHNDGSYTWYAYNSRILVNKGDSVTQGQTIVKAGSTGRAKQDKLHFKIFQHGVSVNPLYYLQ